jgi:hypothetical protein
MCESRRHSKTAERVKAAVNYSPTRARAHAYALRSDGGFHTLEATVDASLVHGNTRRAMRVPGHPEHACHLAHRAHRRQLAREARDVE